MNKPKQKILYLSLYTLLKKKFKNRPYVTNRQFNCELGKHFLVPKKLRDFAIEELISMKIVKRVDKDKLELVKNKSFESDIASLKI